MLAIDTNLVVRYLVDDHPEQCARARRLIDRNEVFFCSTVMLETEWVLRSAYGYSPDRCADALAAFAGLPQVVVEDRLLVATALDWMRQGLDFADALHLAKSGDCEAFVTFDRALVKAAADLPDVEVRIP